MFVTLSVLKLLTSSEVKLLQLMNISHMSVTLAVLKLVTSSEVRLLQSENISFIRVTFSVLNLLTSSDVKLLQQSNIANIVVTWSVFRFSIPTIVFKFLHPLNHNAVLVSVVQLAKESSNTTTVMLSALLFQPRSEDDSNGPIFIPLRSAFWSS